MKSMRTLELLDLAHTAAADLLKRFDYPWAALPEIGSFVKALGRTLNPADYREVEENVWLANSVKRYPGVFFAGPAVIGPGSQLRPGAFIRGNVLVGADCVVGNSTELKNVILFDQVQVPHYNYVGDSILGRYAHMGAGAITSNVKQDKTNILLRAGDRRIETGLRKFGAVLGDHVEVGCNSVLNPGTVVGRGSRIYPLSSVRGFVPGGSIRKTDGSLTEIRD